MKTKLSPVILVGGVLCLVSMLLPYLSIRVLGLAGFPVSWASCARYLNNILYAVPVVGVLVLVSGMVDSKGFQALTTVLGLVVVVWYLVVYRKPLNGDALRYLIGANAMLSSFLNTGVDASSLQAAATMLEPFMHVGLGFIVFVVGVVLNGIGIILDFGIPTGGGSRNTGGGRSTPRSSNPY